MFDSANVSVVIMFQLFLLNPYSVFFQKFVREPPITDVSGYMPSVPLITFETTSLISSSFYTKKEEKRFKVSKNKNSIET